MLQLRGRLDLSQESFRTERGAEVLVQHLDCDIAIVADVVREVNGRHATLSNLALDSIAIGECGAETLSVGGQRRMHRHCGHERDIALLFRREGLLSAGERCVIGGGRALLLETSRGVD
jgi:hypothetical protein